jgi:NEDD4-binding protein 2
MLILTSPILKKQSTYKGEIMEKTLIIMRGCPGSGKSTYLEQEYPEAFICSADQYFIGIDGKYEARLNEIPLSHDYCRNAFKAAVLNELPCIAIDNTNIKIEHFEKYIRIAKLYNYEIIVIRLVINAKKATKRNIHGVPFYAVERSCKQMETYQEEILVNL